MIFISFSSGFGGMLLQAQCGRRQMRHLLRGNFQSTGKKFTMKKVGIFLRVSIIRTGTLFANTVFERTILLARSACTVFLVSE